MHVLCRYPCQASAGDMALGKQNTQAAPIPANMLLDEMKQYDYPLSADQVKAVYYEYIIYGVGP